MSNAYVINDYVMMECMFLSVCKQVRCAIDKHYSYKYLLFQIQHKFINQAARLASMNRSLQSQEGTNRALGMAIIVAV